ncbi:hypothetical protein KAW48_00225 [candidate division WOR-3 bacterium]|nr:hypothetical protein [candidate division WOR-3 bacterium]
MKMHWKDLDLWKNSHQFVKDKYAELEESTEDVSKMLNGLISTLKEKVG